LYVRAINAGAFQPIAGTEGAYGPFWLDDGRAVGFFAGESVRRVDLAGGGVVTIGTYEAKDNTAPRRGTGNKQGALLFADGGIIWRAGERIASRVLPAPGPSGSEDAREPEFLADGQRFLYFAGGKDRGVFLASLTNAGSKRIADTPTPAHYAAGHLLHVQQRTLMARPFDPDRIQSNAADFPVADGVVESHFSAAQNGTIVYRSAESELAALVWFTRGGARIRTLGEVAEYRHVALSPSGRRVAVARGDPDDMDLWVADATSGVFARTTRLAGSESDPVWSPDERSIAYSYQSFGGPAATEPEGVRRLDLATGADGPLSHSLCNYVDDWTSDGRVICHESERLVAVPVSGTGAAVESFAGRPLGRLQQPRLR
jgi:hypothetical protein